MTKHVPEPDPRSRFENEGIPDLQDGVPAQRREADPQEAPLPGDEPIAVDDHGTTVEEQIQGESLEGRLDRERPDASARRARGSGRVRRTGADRRRGTWGRLRSGYRVRTGAKGRAGVERPARGAVGSSMGRASQSRPDRGTGRGWEPGPRDRRGGRRGRPRQRRLLGRRVRHAGRTRMRRPAMNERPARPTDQGSAEEPTERACARQEDSRRGAGRPGRSVRSARYGRRHRPGLHPRLQSQPRPHTPRRLRA